MSRKEVAAIVVVETGSRWPDWVEDCRRDGISTHVIVQQDDEAGDALLARVEQRVEELRAADAAIPTCVIACADRADFGIEATRRALGTTLLRGLAPHGGRLLFSASARQSGAVRRALSEVAAGLSAEWDGTPVSVSVAFGSRGRGADAALRVA